MACIVIPLSGPIPEVLMSRAPLRLLFLLPSSPLHTFLIIFCFFLMVQLKRLIPKRPSSNQLSSPSPLQPPDRRTQAAFIIHPNQIRAKAGWSKLLSSPHPLRPSSPLHSLLSSLEELPFIEWAGTHAHSHKRATHTRAHTLPDPPASHSPVPFLENEQFSHCNNAPLSSAHYRHDKRWNIRGGWPPNLIWARYWSFGKWVLSALIYSLADWPLKLNIITERIFKNRGHKLHQNENIKEH